MAATETERIITVATTAIIIYNFSFSEITKNIIMIISVFTYCYELDFM